MWIDSMFRWIWRVNGVLIFFGLVAVIAFTLVGFLSGLERNAPEPIVSNIASDPEGSEKWVLGRSRLVSGSEILYIPLESENKNLNVKRRDSEYNMYSSGGSYRRTFSKNVLFINTETNEMRWLFDGVQQLITSIDQLPERSDNSKVTKYITYAVIDRDSNNDGNIDEDDNSTLAFSNYDGKAYQVVLSDYERIISEKLQENDVLSVVYQKAGTGFVARYSLEPFKLINRTELPKVDE